jgi:F-type H+-transporting ATPase subunit b
MSLRKRLSIVSLSSLIVLAIVFAAPAVLRFTQIHAQESQAAQGAGGTTGSHPDATKTKKEPAKGETEAAEDENEALKHSPIVEFIARKTGLSLDTTFWLVVVFNFAIVLGIIWKLARKILPGKLKARGEAIQKNMEDARKASEEARQRMADVEGRLSRLDADIEQMRREAAESASAEQQRMRSSAEEERRRIVQAAEQEIAMASAAARRKLKSYVAGLAVDLAEEKIKIAQSADQKLVHEFTTQIGKDGN